MESPNWTFFTHSDAENDKDLDVLINAARESFTLVDRWKETKLLENHEAVNSVITRLVDETASYHMGIMIGVQIADEGLMFAKEAGEFYERLAQVDDVPQAESLDENLSHMCHRVGKAHCGPLTVNNRFRNVRTNMFEIMRAIQICVSEIASMEQAPDNTMNTDRKPLELLTQLQEISGDMEIFIRNTSVFVDWWGNVKQNLKHLQTVVPQIRSDEMNSFRAEIVTQRWKNIRQEYGSYIRRMAEIQDFYFAFLPPSTKVDVKDTIFEEIYIPKGERYYRGYAMGKGSAGAAEATEGGI